jgi:hypothetical protein
VEIGAQAPILGGNSFWTAPLYCRITPGKSLPEHHEVFRICKQRSVPRIKCSIAIEFVVGSTISTVYIITCRDPEMADTSIYDYPSPLKGFENLEPLSECANQDIKDTVTRC